jgi:hypothetical protein
MTSSEILLSKPDQVVSQFSLDLQVMQVHRNIETCEGVVTVEQPVALFDVQQLDRKYVSGLA